MSDKLEFSAGYELKTSPSGIIASIEPVCDPPFPRVIDSLISLVTIAGAPSEDRLIVTIDEDKNIQREGVFPNSRYEDFFDAIMHDGHSLIVSVKNFVASYELHAIVRQFFFQLCARATVFEPEEIDIRINGIEARIGHTMTQRCIIREDANGIYLLIDGCPENFPYSEWVNNQITERVRGEYLATQASLLLAGSSSADG